MAISQLGGFNFLMYYSSTIFVTVGFSNPVAVGTIIAATNFFFAWINMILVDRIGRRRILLLTMPFMTPSLAVAAVVFHWIPVNHDLTLETTNVGWACLRRAGVYDLLCRILLLWNGQYTLAFLRILSHRDPSYGDYDADVYVLGLEHHCGVDVSDADGEHNS